MLAQPFDYLDLLLRAQTGDGLLNHSADAGLVHRDEALVVHEGKEAHDELAIHAVSDAAVAGNRVAKVFDVKGALKAGGEEAAEGSDKRGEG